MKYLRYRLQYPQTILFEPDFLLDNKVVIKLNVNHPFYKNVINPLCGDITKDDDSASCNQKAKIHDMSIVFGEF